ncbi:ATP-dependent helicase [Anaeromyxobacter sp. Fw109-5]|uniref:ATP-dependent helicase n=1 Tax=Anaeromyxobacter sp. (strain Fw109-5) TaxID=404589 RepID=UPI000158A739|nr:UvrD-helicase domain-containing protein [Anaeromyxobacter sp. Fw109-5]ABS24318.1 UvrD/REP helicase [Anaeromyxobacter sp. Fw109-5]
MAPPDPLLEGLNDAQREAVLHGDGPLLVLAGAGSGKTRVIVHRIARLVRDERVMPWHVLAVTFTNKAAGEMKDRLEALLGTQASELWVQTFHAFGARFLRREAARAGLPPSFAIYDDDDQIRVVKRIFQELRVEDGEPLTARQALSRIDRWKNAALRPAEVVVGEYDVEGQLAREVYGRFEAALARAGAVDFGDLLLRPVRLLEEDATVRRAWAGRFRYLLVDEFQDTNAAQYRLLKLLANEKRNVCVVGDDDQAIYRWRGADVTNILEFDQGFPGARVVKLEQNYRSTRTVLDAAHAVISKARRRREKRLWTESGAGETLALVVGQDEHDEAERVARAVAAERARGTAGEEIAVLYRTNAQSRPLEAALRAARIPYVIVRGTSFYDRAEVRDAAAYLRLALSPRSDLDLERVLNRPARGVGEKTLERLRAHASARGIALFDAIAERDAVEDLKPAARRALGEFHALVAGLAADVPALDAGIAVQEALKRSGLLARLEAEHTDEAVERAENLAELVAAAREFDESLLGEPPPRDPEEVRPPPLARFLEQIALLGEADAETPEGRVSLMTLHAAKGLEFEAVFLAGLEDGTLPYERPWSDAGPAEREAAEDEERRLCYVGMTRAKKRLTLSLARRRIGYGEGGPSYRSMEPSRFLADLPPELFGLAPRLASAPAARGPVIRRPPGSLPGEPHIELEEDGPREPPPPRRPAAARAGPVVDYDFDQRPRAAGTIARGTRVAHESLGEGTVAACEGSGPGAKVTVFFDEVGEKRVLARFLRPA